MAADPIRTQRIYRRARRACDRSVLITMLLSRLLCLLLPLSSRSLQCWIAAGNIPPRLSSPRMMADDDEAKILLSANPHLSACMKAAPNLLSASGAWSNRAALRERVLASLVSVEEAHDSLLAGMILSTLRELCRYPWNACFGTGPMRRVVQHAPWPYAYGTPGASCQVPRLHVHPGWACYIDH